jgi:formamidopyrimidine-DNA glycosylase
MPELPEVETVRLGIEASFCGKAIISADVRRYDLRKNVPHDFADRLRKKNIKSLKRRGKYIIFEFADESDEVAILHLGMSGRVHIITPDVSSFYVPGKHDHIIIDVEDGTRFVYEDPRRFGMFYLHNAGDWRKSSPFDVMGPEPLEYSWNGDVLFDTLHRKSAPIKSLLLDQRIVAGLGNIYVCEALYRVGINPKLKGKELALANCSELVRVIKGVLLEAIEVGGSTLRDYKKTDGSLGYFQHRFRVYGREGEACMKEGCSGTIERIIQSGRSTFYCPVCQK